MYIKGNAILLVDAFSRLEFEKVENHENTGDKILHWMKTCFASKLTQKRNK